MQNYNKKTHSANLLFKNFKNYNLQAVFDDFLHYSIPIDTTETHNINTDSINIARAFLPFLMVRSEENASALLDAVTILEIKTTTIQLIKYGMDNGFTAIKELKLLFDFLAIIDQINTHVENAEIVFSHQNAALKTELHSTA